MSGGMTASGPSADQLDRRMLVIGAVIAIGAFAAALDATIVVVALDAIGREFDAPIVTTQWVVTGYLLGIATVIPVTGWGVERFGARTMWLAALAVFLGASLLCGLAWSAGSLVVFRVLQGLGGGLIVPVAQIILAREAGPSRVGRLMALVTIPTQVASILGPTLGGVLVDAISWRWIFYLNVPVCLMAAVLARRMLPADTGRAPQRLDLLGLLLLSTGLALLVLGLSRAGGADGGFGSDAVLVPVLAGVALLGCYVAHALRTRAVPVLDLRLFTSRWFCVLSALMLSGGAILYGALFLFPLYFQQVRGHSALEAGLDVLPHGVGLVLMLFVGGKLSDRFGPRPVILAGLAVMVLGTAVFTQLSTDPHPLLLWAALFVRGLGLGLAVTPLLAAVFQGGLPQAAIPRASTAVNIVQRIGGSFGGALFAVVLQSTMVGGLVGGFDHAFWWVTGVTVLTLGLALLLPRGLSRPHTTV